MLNHSWTKRCYLVVLLAVAGHLVAKPAKVLPPPDSYDVDGPVVSQMLWNSLTGTAPDDDLVVAVTNMPWQQVNEFDRDAAHKKALAAYNKKATEVLHAKHLYWYNNVWVKEYVAEKGMFPLKLSFPTNKSWGEIPQLGRLERTFSGTIKGRLQLPEDAHWLIMKAEKARTLAKTLELTNREVRGRFEVVPVTATTDVENQSLEFKLVQMDLLVPSNEVIKQRRSGGVPWDKAKVFYTWKPGDSHIAYTGKNVAGYWKAALTRGSAQGWMFMRLEQNRDGLSGKGQGVMSLALEGWDPRDISGQLDPATQKMSITCGTAQLDLLPNDDSSMLVGTFTDSEGPRNIEFQHFDPDVK